MCIYYEDGDLNWSRGSDVMLVEMKQPDVPFGFEAQWIEGQKQLNSGLLRVVKEVRLQKTEKGMKKLNSYG